MVHAQLVLGHIVEPFPLVVDRFDGHRARAATGATIFVGVQLRYTFQKFAAFGLVSHEFYLMN